MCVCMAGGGGGGLLLLFVEKWRLTCEFLRLFEVVYEIVLARVELAGACTRRFNTAEQ